MEEGDGRTTVALAGIDLSEAFHAGRAQSGAQHTHRQALYARDGPQSKRRKPGAGGCDRSRATSDAPEEHDVEAGKCYLSSKKTQAMRMREGGVVYGRQNTLSQASSCCRAASVYAKAWKGPRTPVRPETLW